MYVINNIIISLNFIFATENENVEYKKCSPELAKPL